MKINKIREMSSPDLEKELGELKSELFKLRFSLATNGLDNPMKIKEVRKDIAKINTVLTERKIAEAKAYLASTDFKMTVDYFATLTEAEQVELTRLRAEAREFISANEGAING